MHLNHIGMLSKTDLKNSASALAVATEYWRANLHWAEMVVAQIFFAILNEYLQPALRIIDALLCGGMYCACGLYAKRS